MNDHDDAQGVGRSSTRGQRLRELHLGRGAVAVETIAKNAGVGMCCRRGARQSVMGDMHRRVERPRL